MAYVRAIIVNCKKASIRRKPWIPLRDKEIVGLREGPISDSENQTVKMGSTIEVDPEDICYDWTDRKFYRVRNPKGWIYEGCVQFGDVNDG